jgi:hypothetical protein
MIQTRNVKNLRILLMSRKLFTLSQVKHLILQTMTQAEYTFKARNHDIRGTALNEKALLTDKVKGRGSCQDERTSLCLTAAGSS